MHQIYEMHLWGGEDYDFYSGEGSHNPLITVPYLKSVMTFLKSFKKPLIVLDLGCGDFNIGEHLITYTEKYIGVDIVENLIERNKTLFKADNLEFHCLDFSEEELPSADCVILRQVLQHLSNAEIKSIIEKLVNYKYIILTEHIPLGNFEPNKNIISGQGNRVKYNSGVDILSLPFGFTMKTQRIWHEYVLEDKRSRILTVLYELY